MTGEGAWASVRATWPVGRIMPVTVCRHVPFGIFVDGPDGIVGLVENPNLSIEGVRGEEDLPAVGTELDAVVVDIVDRHRQVRLSLRPDHLEAARTGGTGRSPSRPRS